MRDFDKKLHKIVMSIALTVVIFILIALVLLVCAAVFHSPEKHFRPCSSSDSYLRSHTESLANICDWP